MERGSNLELEVILTDLEEIMFATFLHTIATTITDQCPKLEWSIMDVFQPDLQWVCWINAEHLLLTGPDLLRDVWWLLKLGWGLWKHPSKQDSCQALLPQGWADVVRCDEVIPGSWPVPLTLLPSCYGPLLHHNLRFWVISYRLLVSQWWSRSTKVCKQNVLVLNQGLTDDVIVSSMISQMMMILTLGLVVVNSL